jgi:hypothetical protein
MVMIPTKFYYLNSSSSCSTIIISSSNNNYYNKSRHTCVAVGATVMQLVEALRYKPAGHGFDSQWCQWIFSLA